VLGRAYDFSKLLMIFGQDCSPATYGCKVAVAAPEQIG